MPDYNKTAFSPPAPTALVTLRNPENKLIEKDVLMLIDTGADATLLPKSAVEKLNLNLDSAIYYETIGFDGTSSQNFAVNLEMLFLDKNFRGQFLLLEQDYGIIGRNILNSLALMLDGKNLSWSEI